MRTNSAQRLGRLPLPIYAGPPSQARLVELVDDLSATVVAFKAANDELQAQLTAVSEGDVLTRNKVDACNVTIDALSDTITVMSRDIGRLTVGAPANQDTDPLVEARAARDFHIHSLVARGVEPKAIRAALRNQDGGDLDAYRAYRDAFDELIFANLNVDMLAPEVRAALSVGSDPSGGYLVPPEQSAEFIKRLHETSDMRAIARVRTIGSDAWEQPIQTGKGISGGWVAEKGSRPATGTPQVGLQRIEAHEQYAYPELTQKMLEDATLLNPAMWLEEETDMEMVRTENLSFVSGNGVGKPRGFLDYSGDATTTDDAASPVRAWGILQYVPTGASGGFPNVSGISASDANALITLIYKVKKLYRANATWAMNRASIAEIRKLRDANGNYLWNMGNVLGGQPQTLLNYPLAELEDMPDFGADTFPIAFGDFRRGYNIIDRLGLSVLRDPYTNKPMVGFYMRRRVGGDVVDFDAIKLLKAGTS